MRNVTLKRCIRGAYNVPETFVLGGPKWIDEARFDIVRQRDVHVAVGLDEVVVAAADGDCA